MQFLIQRFNFAIRKKLKMSKILTGIQSTGTPHLGNLLGAIIPAIELSNNPANESFLFIADLHSITQIKDEKTLREKISKCWLGDVWNAIVFFARQGYNMELIEIETGIIILKNETHKYKIPHGELTWKWYQKNFDKIFK